MKGISYSLFEAPCERFERRAYIRGFYWNFRMNRLIYPDWKTVCFVQQSIYQEYRDMFDLISACGAKIVTINYKPELCAGMLWRMIPLWWEDVDFVLCRDCDAITTHREMRIVSSLMSEHGFYGHGINDNRAHGGLMGGMIGLEADRMRYLYKNVSDFVSGWNLHDRGSDQHLLNAKIRDVKIFNALHVESDTSNPIWESDLLCRHIGSAGVNEMETLRFFKRHDASTNELFEEMEKKFPDLFYWWI